jgi:RimJ/RimL family protein N-acetyltransferase
MFKKIRQRGFVYLVGSAINRVIPEWMMRYAVFDVFELHDPSASSPPASIEKLSNCEGKSENLAFLRGGTADQMVDIHALTPYVDPDEDRDRRTPYQARLDGQLAGVVWFATTSYQETDLGLCLNLQPKQSWLFAAEVRSIFRGRGVYSRLVRFAMDDQGLPDGQRIFAAINPHNVASMKAHRKIIQSKAGRVRVLRILSNVFFWTRGDGVHLSRCCSRDASGRPLEILIK